MFFHLVTSIGQRKYSEPWWGIESQTFGFCALMLYHWARETLRWARSITKFMTDVLHTARISNADSLMLNVNRNFVPHSWQDEKHLSLFLYCAQNFPSLLFYLCRITIEKSSSSSTNHIEENCNHYGYY